MAALTKPPVEEFRTFMNIPFVDAIEGLGRAVAVVGMPFGSAYTAYEVSNDQTRAPTALRRASQRISQSLDRYDFDIGGPVLGGQDVKLVDLGDVLPAPGDFGSHYGRLEQLIRGLVAQGAFPIILGGDHGIPIPVLRGLDQCGPVTLVQIDAHLDWREEVNRVREGYSSPMRRASEMPHIGAIFQLGIRGQGSARPQDYEAARARATIVTAAEWEDRGTAAVLADIPEGGPYYLTIDADGLDPSVMPAVGGPQPGGVTYRQTIDLIKGLAMKGRLIGIDIVEIQPMRDVNEISCITAGHIILTAIGAIIRAGNLNQPR